MLKDTASKMDDRFKMSFAECFGVSMSFLSICPYSPQKAEYICYDYFLGKAAENQKGKLLNHCGDFLGYKYVPK